MHSRTVVLVPPGTADLWQAGSDLLQPHRLAEDAEPPRPWRFDDKTVGGDTLDDPEKAAALGIAADDKDLAKNVSIVSRLPADFACAAVATPDDAARSTGRPRLIWWL